MGPAACFVSRSSATVALAPGGRRRWHARSCRTQTGANPSRTFQRAAGLMALISDLSRLERAASGCSIGRAQSGWVVQQPSGNACPCPRRPSFGGAR